MPVQKKKSGDLLKAPRNLHMAQGHDYRAPSENLTHYLIVTDLHDYLVNHNTMKKSPYHVSIPLYEICFR